MAATEAVGCKLLPTFGVVIGCCRAVWPGWLLSAVWLDEPASGAGAVSGVRVIGALMAASLVGPMPTPGTLDADCWAGSLWTGSDLLSFVLAAGVWLALLTEGAGMGAALLGAELVSGAADGGGVVAAMLVGAAAVFMATVLTVAGCAKVVS